ncbi:RNA polymerase sigma factor [Terriglobus albidus]|uniref:RNA polymerase sigma factor n=1 Tax=Terriglobus albidus TaxID=1592106 RepID=UPI0021E045F4|nr:sigma-70 family RNA polymerase sigma factor [Terriglobus albidus]
MASREDLYEEAVRTHGPALDRLSRAYEANPEARRDLLQEIHLALWRSLESFDARCSLRTWIYRVAHNVASSHVDADRRSKARQPVSIDGLDLADEGFDTASVADRRMAIERLMELIRELKPLDRQLMLLFLEGVDAGGIAEVTGLSPGNVATKIHRIKNILIRRFHIGGEHGR